MQRLRVQFIEAMPTLTVLLHQMGGSQQAEMFRDRRTRHGKGLGDLSGRQTFLSQQVQNGAARGVGERAENSLRGICNSTVTHNA